jgi:hypothetical protein
LRNPDVDVKIISKCILRKWVFLVYGLDLAGSEVEELLVTYECGNEPPGPTKCGEFLD